MAKPLFAGADAPVSYSSPVKLAGYGSGMLPQLKSIATASLQTGRDETGMNALCMAAKSGDVDVIKYLLSINCDIDAPAWNGMTPLMFAALNTHDFAVQLLVASNASCALADAHGNTAAHYAAKGGSLACLNDIIASKSGDGAKYDVSLVNAKNKAGRTALHVAVNHGQQAVVTSLLRAGADVNAADAKGHTALHCASAAGFSRLCGVLLEAGANKAAKTADGHTAAALAATDAVAHALGDR